MCIAFDTIAFAMPSSTKLLAAYDGDEEVMEVVVMVMMVIRR